MPPKPHISPGDWIEFGTPTATKDAVVCSVYEEDSSADIEIVHLDDRDRAINEDMIWDGDSWKFRLPGPNGGYADKYSRLSVFVAQLRRGQY